jgi:hypothetical protein
MNDRPQESDETRTSGDAAPDDPAFEEYSHVDAETVLEDAVELFEAGSEPPPILYPDDPPPEDDSPRSEDERSDRRG